MAGGSISARGRPDVVPVGVEKEALPIVCRTSNHGSSGPRAAACALRTVIKAFRKSQVHVNPH